MYKLALEVDPYDTSALNSYGLLLKRIHKDYDRAEEMFKRLIDVNPYDVNGLGNNNTKYILLLLLLLLLLQH